MSRINSAYSSNDDPLTKVLVAIMMWLVVVFVVFLAFIILPRQKETPAHAQHKAALHARLNSKDYSRIPTEYQYKTEAGICYAEKTNEDFFSEDVISSVVPCTPLIKHIIKVEALYNEWESE